MKDRKTFLVFLGLVVVVFILIYVSNCLFWQQRRLDNKNGWSIDKTFTKSEKVTDPSKLTLEQLSINDPKYTRDTEHVYFNGKVIENTNPKSFSLILGELYKQFFWFYPTNGGDKKVMAIDTNFRYAKDDKNVYFEGRPVVGADTATFQPIENGKYSHAYGKDLNNVYFHDHIIKDADINTFEILWKQIYEGCALGLYSKDSTHVYFEDKVVVGADPMTFVPLINQYGKDKNGVYLKEKLQSQLDPATFTTECTYG